MKLIILTFIFFLIFYLIILFSYKLKLLDQPNTRKYHPKPTPFTGGISLAICLFIIVRIFDVSIELTNIIIYCILLSLLGLFDDFKQVKAETRIFFQILVILLVIYVSNIKIQSLGNYEYIGDVNLNSASHIFTVACMLVFINAFNYNDGINGAAGSISILILSNLFIFDFLIYNFIDIEILLVSIPILVFLFFNFNFFGKLTFLGNNGSLFLSSILGFIVIYKTFDQTLIEPNLVIWFLSYLVFEFLSVTQTRFMKNKNILIPGDDHLHYLLKKKFGTFFAIIILLSINQLLIMIGYFFSNISNLLSIAMFIIFYFLYYFLRKRIFISV